MYKWSIRLEFFASLDACDGGDYDGDGDGSVTLSITLGQSRGVAPFVENGVFDCFENETDVVSIGGAGDVDVDSPSSLQGKTK